MTQFHALAAGLSSSRSRQATSSDELRAFVVSACTEVGLRVVGMSEHELRGFILKNAERVGLEVTEMLRH